LFWPFARPYHAVYTSKVQHTLELPVCVSDCGLGFEHNITRTQILKLI
jgi:hypothetical protein